MLDFILITAVVVYFSKKELNFKVCIYKPKFIPTACIQVCLYLKM